MIYGGLSCAGGHCSPGGICTFAVSMSYLLRLGGRGLRL